MATTDQALQDFSGAVVPLIGYDGCKRSGDSGYRILNLQALGLLAASGLIDVGAQGDFCFEQLQGDLLVFAARLGFLEHLPVIALHCAAGQRIAV